MIAIGKDLRLQRQEGAPRVDQVNARQSVLERDFLRADVLSYCQRIVGAPLDRVVVGDDQHLAPRHAADPGDDAGARRLVVVEIPRRQRRQLEERGALVEQLVDAVANRQLALLAVPLDVLLPSALLHPGLTLPKLNDQSRHPFEIAPENATYRDNSHFDT